MKIEAEIPTRAMIVNGGFACKATARGEKASKPDFGDYNDKKGVYIFHADGKLLYIGKTTDGEFGNFRERLYRHLSESASVNSRVHKLLMAQTKPTKAYLLDLRDVDMMINPGAITLDDVSKALIMEQILIGVFRPIGNVIKGADEA
jgi:hypothetical protein